MNLPCCFIQNTRESSVYIYKCWFVYINTCRYIVSPLILLISFIRYQSMRSDQFEAYVQCTDSTNFTINLIWSIFQFAGNRWRLCQNSLFKFLKISYMVIQLTWFSDNQLTRWSRAGTCKYQVFAVLKFFFWKFQYSIVWVVQQHIRISIKTNPYFKLL